MKKIFSFLFLISLTGMAFSQIVIDSLYMPQPGQIIPRKSTGDPGSINYAATDSAYIWDFRTLVPLQQTGDTFVSVSSTNIVYLAVFANPFNKPFQATVASPQSMPAIPMVTINDPYYFYKSSNSEYSLLGMGAKINSIPMPVKYDNPDVWYHFPVTFGTTDSSHSKFNISIPNLGYYGQDKRRTNIVDGWGTLYLPTDTFDVIRIKSIVHTTDTLHSDSLGFGIKFNRTDIEYKWIAQEYSVPVLQVTESSGGMGPGSTSLVFIDHTVFPNAIAEISTENNINILPNPSDGHFTLNLSQPKSGASQIDVYNMNGQNVFSGQCFGNNKSEIDISGQPAGIYLLRMMSEGKLISKKLVIY
ncbi:MAG: T9SS type A sorting domain-containing protein [Bacteroidota bacterium]